MGRIATSSGRLKKRERRRRLNAGKPGTVVILDPDGVQLGSSGRRGSSFGSLNSTKADQRARKAASRKVSRTKKGELLDVAFQAQDVLAYDFDARQLVSYVQQELAEHLQRAMREGVAPDTGSAHPGLSAGTTRRTSVSRGSKKRVLKRVSDKRAMRTGTLNAMWGMGPIRGNYNRASASVKPGGDKLDKGRSIFINAELGKGIDYGAVKGDAAKVIARAFDAFMEASKADTRGYVRVPDRLRLAGGFTDVRGNRLSRPEPSPGSEFDNE